MNQLYLRIWHVGVMGIKQCILRQMTLECSDLDLPETQGVLDFLESTP